MLKFAFILDAPGASPEKYYRTYENNESYNLVVGADGMEQTKAVTSKLINDGFTLFNFCGAYDNDMLKELSSLGDERIKMRNVNYLPSEEEKIDNLKSFAEYGIIIKMAGVEESTLLTLKAKGCNTYAIFVKDMEASKEAAQKLVEDGVYFIELCSWFDESMTQEIIDAIDGKVPVGSCGF